MAESILETAKSWQKVEGELPDGAEIVYHVVPVEYGAGNGAPLEGFALFWPSIDGQRQIGISEAVPEEYRALYAAHEARCRETCAETEAQILEEITGEDEAFVIGFMTLRTQFFEAMVAYVDGQESSFADSIRFGYALYQELLNGEEVFNVVPEDEVMHGLDPHI